MKSVNIKRSEETVADLQELIALANKHGWLPEHLAMQMVAFREDYPLPFMLTAWKEGKLDYHEYHIIQLVFAYRNHLPDGGRAPLDHERSLTTTETVSSQRGERRSVTRQGARKGGKRA